MAALPSLALSEALWCVWTWKEYMIERQIELSPSLCMAQRHGWQGNHRG